MRGTQLCSCHEYHNGLNCYFTEPISSKLTNLVPILVQLLTRQGLSDFMLLHVVLYLGNLTDDNRKLCTALHA